MVLRSLRALLFATSALAVVLFTYEGARLVASPALRDPVERAVLARAETLASGGPLYAEPSGPDDPPLMPGYPAAVSLFVRAFWPALWEPRMLALLASLAIAGLVLAIVRLETASWTLAAAGVGFALMGHALLAEHPGVARPESVMLPLALLGFLALRLTNGVGGALLAALLLAAAYFVAAQAGWLVAGALFATGLESRKRLAALTLALGVLIGGGYVGLSELLGPWFNFNAWDGPLRSVRLDAPGALHFVGDHLLGRLAVPTLAMVLSFAMPTPPWRGKGGLWTCLGIAALAGGLVATQSAAFGPHARIPSVVALSLLGPISIQRVTRHLSAWPGSTRLGGQGVVLAALMLQLIVFLACATGPNPTRTRAASRAAGGALSPRVAEERRYQIRTRTLSSRHIGSPGFTPNAA